LVHTACICRVSDVETLSSEVGELRSQRRGNYSPASRDSDGGEPDLMTFLIDFATKNPELLNKILGNVGGSVPVPPKEN